MSSLVKNLPAGEGVFPLITPPVVSSSGILLTVLPLGAGLAAGPGQGGVAEEGGGGGGGARRGQEERPRHLRAGRRHVARHGLVAAGLAVPAPAAAATLPVAADQPGVDQHVLGGDSLAGLLPEQGPDEALGPRGQGVGQRELASPDLGEQAGVLGAVEGIPARGGRLANTEIPF